MVSNDLNHAKFRVGLVVNVTIGVLGLQLVTHAVACPAFSLADSARRWTLALSD
jgi:hypothetical protein